MRVELKKSGLGVLAEVRKLADRKKCNLRAPHHTVSQAGLVGELAFAAGGILVLDEVEAFRPDTLRTLRSHLEFMHKDVRPMIYMLHSCDPDLVKEMQEIRELLSMCDVKVSDDDFRQAAHRKVKYAGINGGHIATGGDCAVVANDNSAWVQVWIHLVQGEMP